MTQLRTRPDVEIAGRVARVHHLMWDDNEVELIGRGDHRLAWRVGDRVYKVGRNSVNRGEFREAGLA